MGRQRHRYAAISATSNTVLLTAPGTLYGIVGTFPAGSVVRVDDSHRFPQGVLDINARSSNTVGHFGSSTTGLGIGLNTGLVVAVSSNASVTVEYE